MDDVFGAAYAGSLARDHVLGALGQRSAVQALADGVPPRQVWEALCDDMDVPAERRLGRDDRAAPGAAGAGDGTHEGAQGGAQSGTRRGAQGGAGRH